MAGVFNTFTLGTFTDPDKINGRDGLLSATGWAYDTRLSQKQTRILSDTSILAAQEKYVYDDTTSQNHVVLLASLLGENELSMDSLGGESFGTLNNDRNVYDRL